VLRQLHTYVRRGPPGLTDPALPRFGQMRSHDLQQNQRPTMLRIITLLATALALATPARAYNDPISRGLADFLNIFSMQAVPRGSAMAQGIRSGHSGYLDQ
jgi:hypothetical protein